MTVFLPCSLASFLSILLHPFTFFSWLYCNWHLLRLYIHRRSLLSSLLYTFLSQFSIRLDCILFHYYFALLFFLLSLLFSSVLFSSIQFNSLFLHYFSILRSKVVWILQLPDDLLRQPSTGISQVRTSLLFLQPDPAICTISYYE